MRERRASHRIVARAVERHRQARNCEFIAEGALRLNQQRMSGAAMMTRIVKETEHGVRGIARTDDRLLAQVELEHPAVNLKVMIDHIATQSISENWGDDCLRDNDRRRRVGHEV